jgi:hypothetical protein
VPEAPAGVMIGPMSVQTSPLAHAYHHRHGSFVSDERFGEWRLKLYGLARPEQGVRPELLDRTRELAASALPPIDEHVYGAAFAIAHDARFPISLIYWWADENEIRSRIYEGDSLDTMSAADPSAFGCVWELGIVEFERRAWIADVIGNPDGPSLDAYMSRRFEGMI